MINDRFGLQQDKFAHVKSDEILGFGFVSPRRPEANPELILNSVALLKPWHKIEYFETKPEPHSKLIFRLLL